MRAMLVVLGGFYAHTIRSAPGGIDNPFPLARASCFHLIVVVLNVDLLQEA